MTTFRSIRISIVMTQTFENLIQMPLAASPAYFDASVAGNHGINFNSLHH